MEFREPHNDGNYKVYFKNIFYNRYLAVNAESSIQVGNHAAKDQEQDKEKRYFYMTESPTEERCEFDL